jgi:hypothetical protein
MFILRIIYYVHVYKLRSVVGIATSYGLEQMRGRSSSPDRVKNFLHVDETGSGVHPTSYPMGTGGKAAEA